MIQEYTLNALGVRRVTMSKLKPKSQAMLDKMMKQYRKDAPAIHKVTELIKSLNKKAPTFKREKMK